MTYRNEFDDAPRGGFLAKIGPKAAFFIVLIALSFMIGAVWKLYSGGSNDAAKNIPIVRADSAPLKVAPDDPGGMEIRHKDSTLFDSMKKKSEGDAPRIENLLADDENEEPMPRSQLFAGLNTEDSPEIENRPKIDLEPAPTPLDEPLIEVTSEPSELSESSSVEAPPALEEVKTIPATTSAEVKINTKAVEAISENVEPVVTDASAPTRKKSPTPLVKPKPVKVAKAPVEVRTADVPVASVAAPGAYYVQLASTKDKARAESEWQKLSKKYDVITGAPYRIETADLGTRGVFYRIQVGPMSRSEAQAKCAAIKRVNPTGCLVKK